MSLTVEDKLSAWVSGLKISEMPDAVVRQAKRSLIDSAGVTSAGISVPVVNDLCTTWLNSTFSSERDHGPSLVPVGPVTAAFLGGTAAHALDFNDYSYDGTVHPGAVIAPAIWAVARDFQSDGASILKSYIAGTEVAMALGRAFTDSMYFQHGWWNPATLGIIGAATSAGSLLRLEPKDLANAICLAIFWTFGPRAVVGTPGKALSAGHAAEVGVRAALLASTGLERIGEAIEGPFGMAAVFNGGTFNRDVINQMGDPFRLEDFDNLTFKYYPSCSLTHTSIEATEILMDSMGTSPGTLETIKEVLCEVPQYAGECLVHDEARTVHEALFSMPYQVGCVLAFGGYDVTCLDSGRLQDPKLGAAAGKIKMEVPDPQPIALQGHRESARVSIQFANGDVKSKVVEKPRGSAGRNLSDNAIEHKFSDCLKAVGIEKKADEFLESLWNLEERKEAFRSPDLLMWPWFTGNFRPNLGNALPSKTTKER